MEKMKDSFEGGGEGPFNDPGGHQSLLRVQVGRRLVDQVNVCWFPQTQSESDSLQLTTRQVLHLRGRRRKQGEEHQYVYGKCPVKMAALVHWQV